MKKIFTVLFVVLLCSFVIPNGVFADELDTPEKPIDINEYQVFQYETSRSYYLGGSSVTVYFYGEMYKDANGYIYGGTVNAYSDKGSVAVTNVQAHGDRLSCHIYLTYNGYSLGTDVGIKG